MTKRNLALMAVASTSVFYGITYSVAKEIMPAYLTPFSLVWIRIACACVLFWITSWVMKSPKLEKKDFPYIIMLSFFGMVLNVMAFYKGLSLTTPINGAVIMVISPIMVLIFSLFLLKEKLHWKRALGIFIGLLGAYFLTTAGKQNSTNAANIPLGNMLVFVNAASYSLYLILAKKMVDKYHPLVFVKWLYTFGVIFMTPMVFHEVIEIQWDKIPLNIYWAIAYVVVFATYFNFLFNLYGLKHLKPTTVSAFIYVQPVVASLFALLLGTDELSWMKISCTLLIFLGVYLVTLRPNETKSKVTV
ncbi:DMT family transporter [Wenyingzhuangia sp. 2_MG-2023]|uniref:DMT family transporter n=1 Tax=Wenyingzhuangia sp. 2_MG-2023 TaxID=3062639 RepID=UPI0026E315AF|nr:EamA family transporter [Wenyingzhuangia sp. 2_MG-2023]MDO6737725.1 EamA family transporter [Wenyingzhuangia sp. 2_MG-2023]